MHFGFVRILEQGRGYLSERTIRPRFRRVLLTILSANLLTDQL